jgi:hypothetical protein
MACRILAAAAASVALSAGAALAQSERQVAFRAGATSTELRGTIRGGSDVTYRLRTVRGQIMQVLFTPSNRSCYFNVFEPGGAEAAHIGSSAGNEFARNPTLAGDYRVNVYLMRNAARRNETCRYRISFEVTGAPGGVSAGVSDRQMRDQCQARASAMYAVRSPGIRMAAIRAGSDGPRIDGTVDKGREGIKRFRCLFTPARELRDVMAMTPDGE